jgi:polar amino acid transport system substrate-binding protein
MAHHKLRVLITSIIASIFLCADARAAEPIVFGVLDAPPFAVRNGNEPTSGFYVEILNTIARHAGLDARFELLPLARVRAMLENDSVTGTLMIANDDVLHKFISAGQVLSLQGIVIGAKSTAIKSFDELHGKDVCLLRGSSLDQRLNEDPEIRKTYTVDYAECIRMFQRGRVHFMAGTKVSLLWNLAAAKIATSEFAVNFVLSEQPVHLFLSQAGAKDDGLVRKLTESVQLAKEDGSINEVANRFMQ